MKTGMEKPRYHKGIICNRCRGKGQIMINIDGEETFNDKSSIRGNICPDCNGRGWVRNAT